ncbi:C-type lectin domain family 4 member M-like [Asterias rubens]|uniref:C-type lectin domain family 4 member M-like n=1 Tax=Asterias rubens TaxID=7604 RepID=UPI00145572C1|nr:C-type lectin domain family 4 member M-like [Asterias rubens]
MVASKLLGVVSIFMIVNYAAGNGQCVASIRGTSRCPPAWSQWQDKCYKMHDAYVTLEEGKEICVEMGGVMVVPQSKEELQQLLNMFSVQRFWIGCNDVETEGTWECLDEGTIEVQNEMWADGEPNNDYANELCAVGSASGLHDVSCYPSEKLICQRPVAPALLLL